MTYKIQDNSFFKRSALYYNLKDNFYVNYDLVLRHKTTLFFSTINLYDLLQSVVDRYNDRKDNVYSGEEFEAIASELTNLIMQIKAEFKAGDELGIDFEEKAFYDILKALAEKYDFTYPKDKLLYLAKEVKQIVDDKAKYIDWSKRNDIKAELKVDLIILLGENGYPPVDRDEVYKEIFEQAENFKKNSL